jgi:hypothetical protein
MVDVSHVFLQMILMDTAPPNQLWIVFVSYVLSYAAVTAAEDACELRISLFDQSRPGPPIYVFTWGSDDFVILPRGSTTSPELRLVNRDELGLLELSDAVFATVTVTERRSQSSERIAIPVSTDCED